MPRATPPPPSKIVSTKYVHKDGREIWWSIPVPCSPAMLREIDERLAQLGYERVEETDPGS